jgi:hypothetical protein
MTLLISMSDSLLAWNAGEPYCWRVHAGSGVYYGISFSDNRIFVAARRFPLDGSEADAAQSNGVILVFDSRLNLLDELSAPFPVRDMHQILWDGGRLFVTAPYDDLVAIREEGAWRPWRPLPPCPRRERPSGGRHYNSLLRQDAELFLLAHNFGPSEVFVFDAATLALQRSFPIGDCAHNLWHEGLDLLTCSSAEGLILSSAGPVAHTGNFPRGIVVAPQDRYVGISMFLERRDARGSHDSFVAHYDRQWRLAGTFGFRGMGMIHDIRCPGIPDAAHPHLRGEPIDLREVERRGERIALEAGANCPKMQREPAPKLRIEECILKFMRKYCEKLEEERAIRLRCRSCRLHYACGARRGDD